MSLAAEFGTGQVLWSFFWFFMFMIWIWVLIVIFGDIFRSPDLSGWAKALWVIFVVVFPWLGILAYLIARGSKMQERALQAHQAQEQQLRRYVQETATEYGNNATSTADELMKLSALRDSGVLSEQEFLAQKARLLAKQH
jgi:type VI protein secretion system component VasK